MAKQYTFPENEPTMVNDVAMTYPQGVTIPVTLPTGGSISEQELRSYRLTSMEEPTDEMLHAIMEKVAESARRSKASAKAVIDQRLAAILSNQ